LRGQQIKQKALKDRLKALTEHYQALIQQVTSALDAQEETKLKQHLRDFEDEMAVVEGNPSGLKE
jgi:hypothetical protein